MHKPNPAKFNAPMYFQYLKMFHVYPYLELSRFFLPIAKEFGRKTFSEIFERKSALLLRRDYFTFNLETNYWNSNSNFISRVFLRENPLNKGVNNKSVDMFNIITHRKHRRIGIMEYVKLESRDRTVTGSHKLRFRKKTGYLQTCYQLVNILVYSAKSMGQKSSNQYHQFKNCPVYQTMKSLDLIPHI